MGWQDWRETAGGGLAAVSHSNSECIELSGAGTPGDPLGADATISPQARNIAECIPDGFHTYGADGGNFQIGWDMTETVPRGVPTDIIVGGGPNQQNLAAPVPPGGGGTFDCYWSTKYQDITVNSGGPNFPLNPDDYLLQVEWSSQIVLPVPQAAELWYGCITIPASIAPALVAEVIALPAIEGPTINHYIPNVGAGVNVRLETFINAFLYTGAGSPAIDVAAKQQGRIDVAWLRRDA